jgi:DNA-binding CsgD family transcriptional regulator
MPEYGEPLSQREREVLELMATGLTNRQIAHELVVSVNTVKVHLRNIFIKLGTESRTEATLVAIREGWVSVPTEEKATAAPAPGTTAMPPADVTVEAPPTLQQTEDQVQILPPLPWPKRLALIGSLLLVALVSAVTWPQSQTSAVPPGPDTDNIVSGGNNVGVLSEDSNWRPLAPMTTARSRFALVATPDGGLLAIGGETNGGTTGVVERYDPETDQWTLLTTSKPTRVSNIGAAAIGAWVYVPGGLTAEGEPTAVVEAYDPTREAWHEVAPLPHPLSAYALAVYTGRVYLFGGRDDRGYANTTYVYDPGQDTWREGKAMPTRRAYGAAATLGSRIFVIGGYDGQREQTTCEVYSPETDAWESCEPLTQGRGGLGLAGAANRLFAIGGGWSNYLGFSEKYSLGTTDANWVPFETPVSRQWRNLALAFTPDKFYVAGGWNGDYLNGAWEYVVLPWRIYLPAASP